ncbi:hypothetical protein [Lysobacter sp. A3-1-A15]|uniref:hypothetical protein n=1 Tax=Novilysobacter viscosus TaxID=3098602 RepID=UPI002EDB2805
MDNNKHYWFPAKSYGWGWGFPKTWQGWLVLLAYLAGIAAAVVFVRPEARPIEFYMIVGALTIALLIVCWFKGEPPKWRWGRN